jgi:hypothetical protein
MREVRNGFATIAEQRRPRSRIVPRPVSDDVKRAKQIREAFATK